MEGIDFAMTVASHKLEPISLVPMGSFILLELINRNYDRNDYNSESNKLFEEQIRLGSEVDPSPEKFMHNMRDLVGRKIIGA